MALLQHILNIKKTNYPKWNNIVPFMNSFEMLMFILVCYYSIRFNFKPFLQLFQADSSSLKIILKRVPLPYSLSTSITAE